MRTMKHSNSQQNEHSDIQFEHPSTFPCCIHAIANRVMPGPEIASSIKIVLVGMFALWFSLLP